MSRNKVDFKARMNESRKRQLRRTKAIAAIVMLGIKSIIISTGDTTVVKDEADEEKVDVDSVMIDGTFYGKGPPETEV